MSRETVYFYGRTKGPYACFSQFYPCSFVDEDGAAYGWAEQFMMAGKARVMGDDATLASIMAARDPTMINATHLVTVRYGFSKIVAISMRDLAKSPRAVYP